MQVNLNTYSMAFGKSTRKNSGQREQSLAQLLKPVSVSKEGTVSPLREMRGINPNSKNVFDTFNKIDDVTRRINFVKSESSWDKCLDEEISEFTIARNEYKANPTQANYDHMEEEMGDIFYTASSIAKNSGIDPEQAFKSTNRKFFNRINVMERLLPQTGENSLKNCRDYERRALWETAKKKLYSAQNERYQNFNNISV